LKLLILSASAGNGHVSAAKALLAVAISRGIDAHHEDVLDHTGEAFRRWYAGGYETLVRRNPRLWGYLYWRSDRAGLAFRAQTRLDNHFSRRLEPLIADQRPDWILCTHSLPQPWLAKVRIRYGFRAAVCVTDLYPHRMWLRGRPDRYFLPTESSRDELVHRIPWSAPISFVTGMPVHPAFFPADLAPSGQILLTAGGISGGPILAVADALASLGAELTVVTGRNEALRQALDQRFAETSVKVRGQISLEEMAEQMRQATVLVGKPGGLTTFEALTSGLPMVVYSPMLIPGQEEENARFLSQSGSGVVAGNLDALRSAVAEILGSEDRQSLMRQYAMRAAPPGAAARQIESLYEDAHLLA